MKNNRPLHSVFIFLFSLLSTTLCARTAVKSLPATPQAIVYDSLDWAVPRGDSYRTILKSGTVAYIAPDSQLPLVQMVMYIKYGDLADPAGKEGISSLLTTLMRSGGTQKYPADTLDELIELMAMNISLSSSESMLTLRASFLAEYTDNALSMLEQILFHPVFEQPKLDKERAITLEGIKHQFDNPAPTLAAAYNKVMYPNSPASSLVTDSSIKKITRKDLVDLHAKIFIANNIIVCAAGSFNGDSLIARLTTMLPEQKTVPQKKEPFPLVSVNRKPACLLVHKDISQAYVHIDLPLIKRPNPDYYALSILNMILGGGGFTSRLGTKVRSDAGLTYSIYSSAGSNYIYPATFSISFFTKNESFAEATALTLHEVQTLIDSGTTEEELSNAKASMLGELPSMFRSSYDIVSTYGWNEYYHRSPDHFIVYQDKIKAITRKDLSYVAHKYLNVDSMSVTVVGDTTALLSQEANGFSLKKRPHISIAPAKIPFLP